MLAESRPTLVVRQPAGYLVPQEWSVCRDRMDLHGIRYRRFAQPWTDSVDVVRIVRWTVGELAEGHRPTRVEEVAVERRLRTFRPGDLWVPLDQPGATVAMQLFEAQAPDALMRWNYFDTVFEFKEYAEDYVMEPIARRMLAEDASLRREFEARLAADSAFARDPKKRLDFFFRRSPWSDAQQNQHPVARAKASPPERALEAAKP